MNRPDTAPRVVIGATTTALLLGDPVDSPDSELLAACAAYHDVRRQWREPGISDAHSAELCGQDEALLHQIVSTAPLTLEGLRAKALAGRTALIALTGLRESWRDTASLEVQIAVDTLGLIAGRAAA